MQLTDWITAISSVVALIISLAAMWQTHKQLELSNKHQLFDRRLDKYILVGELFKLLGSKDVFLEDVDGILIAPGMIGVEFVDCAMLDEMSAAMYDPTEEKNRKAFTKKCEMLEHAATEIKLIWTDKNGEEASGFVMCYKNLLYELYSRNLSDIRMEQMFGSMLSDMEDSLKEERKNRARNEMKYAVRKLKDAYKQMCDHEVIPHLAEQMKLEGK